MAYNFKLERLEQIFLEYSYSKNQLIFLKKANFKSSDQYSLFKEYFENIVNEINIFYLPLDKEESMIVKFDYINPRIYINSNIVALSNLDYFCNFGIFAIINKMDLEFNAFNDSDKFYKIDDLVKKAFRENVEIKSRDINNKLIMKFGQKFIYILLNALKDREISYESAKLILQCDIHEIEKLYQDLIYLAYIDKLNHMEI